MTRVLEKMGIFGDGREQFRNVEEQNCTPNQSASTDSPGHEKTLPFTDLMEEQREPIPSMEKPLEVGVHEEEVVREENQTVETGPMDPLAEANPADETLVDENQPGNTIFSKSPEDEAYPQEDLENENCLGNTIVLGSPEK